jgi:hypothetical protein
MGVINGELTCFSPLMKQQDSKSVTDQRLSSLNKRKPLTKLGVGLSNHHQKVSVGYQDYGLLSAERSRNRKLACHCSPIKYAHLPCEVRNRFRMTHSWRLRSNIKYNIKFKHISQKSSTYILKNFKNNFQTFMQTHQSIMINGCSKHFVTLYCTAFWGSFKFLKITLFGMLINWPHNFIWSGVKYFQLSLVEEKWFVVL